MKKPLLLTLVATCLLALTLGLAGCGGSGGGEAASDAPDVPGTPTTIQYASFNMPDGWADRAESSSYVSIVEEADGDHVMKIFVEHLFSGDTIQSVAEKEASYYGDDALGEAFEMGGYTWIPVSFTFNDNPSRKFYTQLDDENYAYVTTFEMTEDDEPVQIVLSTLSLEVSE